MHYIEHCVCSLWSCQCSFFIPKIPWHQRPSEEGGHHRIKMKKRKFSRHQPDQWRYCYFWAGKKTGCSLEQCYYEEDRKEENGHEDCRGCPYGRTKPCIGWCTKKILLEHRQRKGGEPMNELWLFLQPGAWAVFFLQDSQSLLQLNDERNWKTLPRDLIFYSKKTPKWELSFRREVKSWEFLRHCCVPDPWACSL